MLSIIPDLESRGTFTPDEISMMQVIYLSVCAERGVALDDHATREAIAHSILHEAELGNWDVTAITAVARAAKRPAS